MEQQKKLVNEFKVISAEYSYIDDIFNEDDMRMHLLKFIINKRLSQVDRTIILLYTDCQSYRKLGEKMGMSHMTIRREVVRIKKQILKEYERLITVNTDCGLHR